MGVTSRRSRTLTMTPLKLLVAACFPVIRLTIMATAGVALRWSGDLDNHGTRALGTTIQKVFLPSLVFTKIVTGVDVSMLEEGWHIPLVAILAVVFGALFGKVCAWWLVGPRPVGSNRELAAAVIATSTIGNTGNLPLVFVAALCDDPNGPYHVMENCDARGMGLVMLGMWVGTMAQWTIGWAMLEPPSTLHHKLTDPTATTSTVTPTSDDLIVTPKPQRSLLRSFLFGLLNPPVFGVLMGFLVCFIPPLKAFVVEGPLIMGFQILETFGGALIPAVQIVLGSNLSKGPPPVRPAAVISVGVIRLVLLPALNCTMLLVARHIGLIPADPLITIVAMVIGSSPSAIQLNTITTIRGGFGQDPVSAILFYQYLTAAITMTCVLAVGMTVMF